jgi:transketolase
MRNKFAETLYRLSKKNRKIRLVAADISPAGKMSELSKKYPDRFINVGVAETSMISMCAGLAMRGLKPFAYTIAPFSIFRPFEMVRIDIGYQNLPVVIVGMGAGTTYSTLGGTHITQEDVSIIRSLPNFTVLSPCDPLELEKCVEYLCSKNKSPCYLRIGKAGEKNFTNNLQSYEKWSFNKPRTLVKGKSKICLIATGPIIRLFFDIHKKLKLKKIFPSIISFHTLKPINKKEISKIFIKNKILITLEDMSEINGLSSIIKNAAYENNFKGIISSFSLKDKNLKNYGSQDDLLNMHGISAKKIYNQIIKIYKNI